MNIVLSGNLRRYTDFEGEVELDAASISEALDAPATATTQPAA